MATTTSYTNLLAFLLTTLFYYLGLKPSLKLEQVQNAQLYDAFVSSRYKYLAIYFLLVMVIQFVINISVISNMCGGNIGDNIGYSGLITFFPWTLIFGVMMTILVIYPSFQKIFSNVFGYYFIASSASKLLTELLISKDIQANIDKDPTVSGEDRGRMQDAADMIIKICGNTSIILNQMSPTNFMEYWKLLGPLMKSRYAGGTTPEAQEIQNKLFELIITKENIGEASWYIYTGVLLVSLVQLKIATRGCVNNSATQQQNYQDFLAKEKEASEKKQQATSTVYTISS